MVEHYLTGVRTELSPAVVRVLGLLDQPAARDSVVAALGDNDAARLLVADMLRQNLLVANDSELADREDALDTTWTWGLPARLLHFSTQRLTFLADSDQERERLRQLTAVTPPPSAFKSYGTTATPLTDTLRRNDTGPWQALKSRRTRRDFIRSPISTNDFVTLLQWTWGRTAGGTSPVMGEFVLKTSPSGGARHAIEVYPLVLRVAGIEPGLYHYDVQNHSLELLSTDGSLEGHVDSFACGQGWLRDAACLFLMTAVVTRSMWKYKNAHAYRVLHLDAGHLGQTFHLVATALGLAPFTTTATDNHYIEQLLNLDGIAEIAVYTAAVAVPSEQPTSRNSS
jgi:SagB-type dehydrogenase family enzyme